MTRHAPLIPDRFRVTWPIGLTFCIVLGEIVLTPVATALRSPFDVIAHFLLVAVLAVACIGSASRLYGLLQTQSSDSRPA